MNDDNKMLYICGDGKSFTFLKPLTGKEEDELAKKHKGIKDVKKVKSV